MDSPDLEKALYPAWLGRSSWRAEVMRWPAQGALGEEGQNHCLGSFSLGVWSFRKEAVGC